MLFTDLNLISPILKALEKEGYESPTPIQEKAIPHILQGRDVLGSAQTGTGKTAAFAIPTLQILSREREVSNMPRTIKSLILTPTRELAIQIEESFTAYGKNLGLRHAVVFGGVSQYSQTEKLRKGIDILVATPGRLLDLMNQGFVNLKHVEIFILDEADRMLDMGFINDVKKVLTKLPVKKQTLFFSATMPKEILGLANSILVNPIKIEVAPVSSTANTIKQSVYFVRKNDKRELLADLLKSPEIASALVFTRTKHGANRVVENLEKAGIVAEAIHGNKSQNARQRALSNFKTKQTRVLVATDIAARGIDIDDLSHVINYDIPNESETYVHRIGRTGRAGLSGTAISFCDQDEIGYLQDIQKLISKKIDVVEDHDFAMKMPQNPTSTGSKNQVSSSSKKHTSKPKIHNSNPKNQTSRSTQESKKSFPPKKNFSEHRKRKLGFGGR
ncbi:MAG: DEAD/DEAH box helicase [Candidatus Gracilibacteria bacterium]|nr:DEAD/DEAH box helicase [Candidatus Gracilibacteria bacterium]MDD4531020.1 DEAD/DEAH box helicase [Candidatus Gracilibacteria bacterium]